MLLPSLGQGDAAGALQLDDPIRAQQLLEVVELARARRRAMTVSASWPTSRIAALEHLHQLDDLAAVSGAAADGHQHQLALDRLARVELA